MAGAAQAVARALLQLVNVARREHHLQPLRPDPRLQRAARVRVHETTRLFDHARPGGTLGELLRTVGIPGTAYGENLALIGGHNSERAVQEAHRGLLNSPGHRANILRPEYRRAGIAARQHGTAWYFVQLFTG
ncbi:hypothetical protein BH23CHL2_BH23CHL2_19700 [soil metagenome]